MHTQRRFGFAVLGLAALALLLAGEAHARAGVFTFNTSDAPLFNPLRSNQGWWSATLDNVNDNDDYFVGQDSISIRNNFFTFHLGSLDLTGQRLVSATLNLTRFEGGGDPTETLRLGAVTTPSDVLNAKANSPSATIFNDLGTGTLYGTFPVTTSGDPAEVLSFPLDAAVLSDIAAHAGQPGLAGDFSIGGSLDLTGKTDLQFLFAQSGFGSGIQSLVIVTEPVPEPSSLALFGLGGLALAGWRRWKGKRATA